MKVYEPAILERNRKGIQKRSCQKENHHSLYNNGSSTIPDLSRELDLSVPTVTKFIGEMCDEGYIGTLANFRGIM